MTTPRKSQTAAKKSHAPDAIALLTADHNKVKGLFGRFEKLMEHDDAADEKADLVTQICNELTVHAQVEEDIFYPAVREAIDDDDLMDEADVEHAGAKELIAQLEAMQPDDALYDAKVVVLGEQIEHHVEEEESEMFPQVKKAGVDTVALGEQMLERKLAIMAELGLPNEDEGTVDGGGMRRAGQKPTSTSTRI